MGTNEEHKTLRTATLQHFGGGTFTKQHSTFDDMQQVGFVPRIDQVTPDGAAAYFVGGVAAALDMIPHPSRWQRARRWVWHLVTLK